MTQRGRHVAPRGEFRAAVVATAVVVLLLSGAAWAVSGLAGHSSVPVAAHSVDPGPGSTAQVAPSQRAAPRADVAAGVHATAVIANLNLYGCTESAPSWPSCTQRFPAQWDYLNRYGIGIVGLQELEPAPYQLFRAKTDAPGSRWAIYPRSPHFLNQQTTGVLWRTDQWRLVTGEEFSVIKYSWRDSGGTHATYASDAAVLLEAPNRRRLWVLSVHNMSSENVNFRSGLAQDEAVEADEFAKRLASGVPVVLMGDFNDDSAQAICAVKARTPSAHSIWDPTPAGTCGDPGASRGQPFDKIIGSRSVIFLRSGIDWSTQTNKLTDHGIAWVDADIS